MSGIAVTLLGGFAAAVDDEPVSDKAWRLKKARDLVKLLALAPGHRLHREQAMDALWRDRDPASAANNLYQAVHAARRALGADAVEVRDEMLRLRAVVDVDRFRRAAADAQRSGTPAAYRAAVSLYRGELLPENRYDDWAVAARDELARVSEELGDELERLGATDGLRGLPVDASSFVGREHELGELRALLARTRLLTLAGTGGAGKTRLALELARGAEKSYGGGAALVELAAVTEGARVADATAVSLDVRSLPGGALIDAIVDFLAPRAVLLVLDNCEHVLGASASLVDALLRGAPRLTVLATSREPLRVPGEVVFRVPSLVLPDPERPRAPDDLLRYEAVRLFVERATAAAPGFELNEENAADVAHICFRLDGLPLALELAAGRLGALSAKSIAERLDDRFRLLRSGSQAAPTRQQTLAATLQWSHDLLEPDERVLLRRLAVFAGGFQLAAVEEVCAGDGLDTVELPHLLARLVEKSLVSVDDSSDERRYRLLETVRLYARERLDEAAETDALAGRHAHWALALAERGRASPELDREAANLHTALDTLLARDPTEALRLCVALWPFWMRRIQLAEAQRRLGDALAAAPERSPLRVAALVAAGSIVFRAGTIEQGEALALEALEIAVELGDARLEWMVVDFLGSCAVGDDEADESAKWFERGLALARREGLASEEALGVYSLGVAQWLRGDLDAAEELVGQSVDLIRNLALPPGETLPSPVNIGETLLIDTSDRPGPRIVFEETLQPFFELGHDAAVGYVLANLASLVRSRGDLARARTLLEESEAYFARAGDERGRADVLVRRAYIELASGSVPAAHGWLVEALELRRRGKERRGIGLVLVGLGQVETAAGDSAEAERHLIEARDLFRRAGDRWGLTSTLWRTAELAFVRNDLDGAKAALEEALRASEETKRDRWIAFTLAGLADVAIREGDTERAESLLVAARDRFAARSAGAAVASLDERLRTLAQTPQRARKGRAVTTPGTRPKKGR